MKTAIITGISGQDGPYLAKLLLSKNYRVIGTVRSHRTASLKNLEYLGIQNEVLIEELDLLDMANVIRLINKYIPDEIYNLAAQSSVGLSFEQPIGTFSFNTMSVNNLLESIRLFSQDTKFYQASSSEMYGKVDCMPIKINTPMHPVSPYAVSKMASHFMSINYRESYNLFVCNGILFNHESFLRPNRFVTMKIINTAIRIFKGSKEKLTLGNIKIQRDWGWAPEYVEAMYLMLQQENAEDFVIATGLTISLEQVIEHIFNRLNLKYKDYLVQDTKYLRPTDILSNHGNPNKALNAFNWSPKIKGLEVFDKMLEYELSK